MGKGERYEKEYNCSVRLQYIQAGGESGVRKYRPTIVNSGRIFGLTREWLKDEEVGDESRRQRDEDVDGLINCVLILEVRS